MPSVEPSVSPSETLPTQDPPTSEVSPPTPDAYIEIDLDFSSLVKGEYVDPQFAALGLTLSASGGEDTRPRVFDTSDPVDGTCGDPDLGSPNMRCENPGPGTGEEGEPDGKGPNCNPLGNVLIVQEPGEECPDEKC
jgi:hypothetical protein